MDLLARHSFAVVMTDFKMPDVCGSDLLGLVGARFPTTIRIMLSGSADSRYVPAAIAGSILNCQVFVSKPWNDEELRTTIRRCIAE
jgi:YesN/AraC family two-component response regulator